MCRVGWKVCDLYHFLLGVDPDGWTTVFQYTYKRWDVAGFMWGKSYTSWRGCVWSHVLEVDGNLYGLTTSMCRVDGRSMTESLSAYVWVQWSRPWWLKHCVDCRGCKPWWLSQLVERRGCKPWWLNYWCEYLFCDWFGVAPCSGKLTRLHQSLLERSDETWPELIWYQLSSSMRTMKRQYHAVVSLC
jgi:hypothetical protein